MGSSNNHFTSNTTITFASSTLFTKPTQSTKMAFFKTLLIASVAAVAFASEGGNTKISGKTMASNAVCGNGQKLACCNSGEDLIGANCLSIPILAIPIQQACGSNVAACCQTGDAKGNLINLELNCLSIPL